MVAVTAIGPIDVRNTSSRMPDEESIGRNRDVLGRAIVQDDAELVSGEPADEIVAAHLGAQAPGDERNNLVGDFVAIGLVDAREIVDRDQKKPAGRTRAEAFLQGFFRELPSDASD